VVQVSDKWRIEVVTASITNPILDASNLERKLKKKRKKKEEKKRYQVTYFLTVA
jgi:hypothetical protein